MALKSVVVDTFFDDVTEVLRRYEASHGRLNLALLTPSRFHRLHWDLVIAAQWTDRMSPLQAIGELHQFMRAELANESRLDGATVRSTTDWLVREVLSCVDIPSLGTAYHVIGLELGDRSSDEVVCLVARPIFDQHDTQKAA